MLENLRAVFSGLPKPTADFSVSKCPETYGHYFNVLKFAVGLGNPDKTAVEFLSIQSNRSPLFDQSINKEHGKKQDCHL